MDTPELSRKAFLLSAVAAAAAASMPLRAQQQAGASQTPKLTVDDLKTFAKVADIEFTDQELEQILKDVADWQPGYAAIRELKVADSVEPRTVFTPLPGRRGSLPSQRSLHLSSVAKISRPKTDEDLAFTPVRILAELIRTRQVTSVELTQLSLTRLKKYGDALLCLVTLLEDQAMDAAREADREIKQGHLRGPLHGIPCGLKDLFAFQGTPTTWGAEPYRSQVLDVDSAVVGRLRAAGAVFVAKLSMGALAMGDVWFKGRTKNPWNLEEGSSGSSAGSAAAVSAGLMPFAIGTETLGSIVSPSIRCRVTGLRPTYGSISRYGAMGLSYTMDKVGPICRTAEDCAIVFHALAGEDARDPSTREPVFNFDTRFNLSSLRVGIVSGSGTAATNSEAILGQLKKLGVEAIPFDPPKLPDGILAVLEVEAATAFDAFTRGDEIDHLGDSAWPQIFRASRFVPAVEYLMAQRARTLLMQTFESSLGDLDAIVAPGNGGTLLRITNLTGHPQVAIPQGVTDGGSSASISFVGRLREEDTLLTLASHYQELGDYHRLRPNLSKLG